MQSERRDWFIVGKRIWFWNDTDHKAQSFEVTSDGHADTYYNFEKGLCKRLTYFFDTEYEALVQTVWPYSLEIKEAAEYVMSKYPAMEFEDCCKFFSAGIKKGEASIEQVTEAIREHGDKFLGQSLKAVTGENVPKDLKRSDRGNVLVDQSEKGDATNAVEK